MSELNEKSLQNENQKNRTKPQNKRRNKSQHWKIEILTLGQVKRKQETKGWFQWVDCSANKENWDYWAKREQEWCQWDCSMIDRYSNKTSSIRQQNTKWKHTCSKRSNVQPKNANHRKTYRTRINVGIGGIVPVNSFDPKFLKERTCAWEAMNQKNENAMKTKTRNTTLQRAKFNNSTSDQQITRIARLMESKERSLLVDCCSKIYFSSQFLRNCANETSRNAKHSENKHRAKIREANELWDRPSERVASEIAWMIWKRRVSAKKEENARKQETFEQTKKYWNFIDKTKNDTKPKSPQNSTTQRIINYRNWRFGMPANDGMDPVKLLLKR